MTFLKLIMFAEMVLKLDQVDSAEIAEPAETLLSLSNQIFTSHMIFVHGAEP